jgi:hypothetical protein
MHQPPDSTRADDDGTTILRGYGHHHDLHDAHMQTGFFTLAGIMTFFVLEKVWEDACPEGCSPLAQA